MKGLELCEGYFREEGPPVLKREFGELFDRMAIGLVGDGSECYGYDDEISGITTGDWVFAYGLPGAIMRLWAAE